jgi:hypothetical protein
MNVPNQLQNSLNKKNRSNDALLMNQNNFIDSQMYYDSNTNVVFHQKIQKHQSVPSPSSFNKQLINSPSSSVSRALSSNESDDDFH